MSGPSIATDSVAGSVGYGLRFQFVKRNGVQ